jgi:peptide/nickel transport system substrate-binding protein
MSHFRPLVRDLLDDCLAGRMSRRRFVRLAALLGESATAAWLAVGLGLPSRAGAAPDQIQRGGRLKVAAPVHKVTHPAQLSWIAPSNQLRQVAEYLPVTDEHNVTHPWLLQKWRVSDDLKTWTLDIRPGVKFNNGHLFTADDVVFTIGQWLDKSVGSSMLGLMGGYLAPTGIEKVNDRQVRLHLKRPEIAVAEHLFHYPALMLDSRTFEGDFIKRPHGTGPFVLEKYAVGQRCVVKRRPDYWRKGADGKSLPYLDRIDFTDMGQEMAPQIAALRSGQVDVIDLSDSPGADVFRAVRGRPGIRIRPVQSAAARVLRMRVDLKPFNDVRVRRALTLCQHRPKILALAYFKQGLLADDFHVYPKHPEYCPQPRIKYDPEQARHLLGQAGYPDGLRVELAVGSGWSDVVRLAEILQHDARPAGFKIQIRPMPNTQYWEQWTQVPLGITPWTHRPLGTMVLNLAYTADAAGRPVPWNETRWVDPEFSKLLREASSTLEAAARRKIFCRLEKIQMERGSIGIPFWRKVWLITRDRVKGARAHPNLYFLFNQVWLKP